MRIHDLVDRAGKVFAFEVPNAGIGRGGACSIASEVPGSTLVRGPRCWSWLREAAFCEFDVNGQRFVIEGPFGDTGSFGLWKRRMERLS